MGIPNFSEEVAKQETWKTFNDIEEHEFRGHTYRAFRHDFYHHANEAESRNRNLSMEPGTTMIDVGAACGTWTLPGSFLAKEVYSLEPFSWIADELRRNLDLNGIKNVRIMKVMGWDHTGTQEVSCCTGTPDGSSNIAYHGEAQLVAIDDLVASMKIEKVGFIKIDVEGAELRVLQGAMNTIKNHHPRVMVEIHTSYGVSINAVADFFNWISPYYGCTLMPQGDHSKMHSPCSIFGQTPGPHFHGLFEVITPKTQAIIDEWGPVKEVK